MRSLITLLLAVAPSIVFGQLGTDFHQSNLPFIGLSYEIKDRLRPEIRIGIDNYFKDIFAEGILTYDILNNEDYEFYAGLGMRANGFIGLVVPVGINIYPLTTKNFGFHIELAPIIGESDILRGSWGIRYRFRNVD